MTAESSKSEVVFCNDSQLLYDDYQTEFAHGRGLRFDESYRLAHLPLIAPEHPRVIKTKPGTEYNCGIHDLVFSIVLPIYAERLYQSSEFKRLCDEVKLSGLSHKLSWTTFSKRKHKLHATVCGAISTESAPYIEQRKLQKLREIGPVSVKIRGLFSGNLNIGRLYLKVDPEQRDGENMLHVIQRVFDSAITHLYVVGLFNFKDELNVAETQELKRLLNRWQDVEFLHMQLEELWVLKSRDDLVLNGSIEKNIPII